MDENVKLQKQITEAKYLNQENTYRYRPIMRFCYNKYEQAEYWLYKEDVFDGVKDLIKNYTMEECERDLDFLVTNFSLTKMQDTKNINSLEEFKLQNFRYQMTDYAVAIERLTIELEEMEVKVSSLEPRLFERIYLMIKKLRETYELDEQTTYDSFVDLTNDFKNLNEQYQDFLKKFHEAKTEELLQSEVFLQYKNSMINYINNFISSYIKYDTLIKEELQNIDEDKTNYLMDMLISHQKKAPKTLAEFDYDKLRKVNYGKWNSIRRWFINNDTKSEGERLLEATENVIEKIYKYAASLIELHGNMINRKEEYKYICKLFDKQATLKDAQKLSGSVFGIIKVKHLKGISNSNTDSLVNSYNIVPTTIEINTTNKDYKIKSERSPIIDKTFEKEEIIKKKIEQEQKRKEVILSFIKKGEIRLENDVHLDMTRRRYALKLIEKYKKSKIKETEFGYFYTVEDLVGKCRIISEDGIFEMNSKRILIDIPKM